MRAAREHPGELIGLVTGPLTNLALAMRLEPALPRLLRRLVIMGGAFDYRGNTTPVAEWNISVDPESAAEVFTVWGAAWGLDMPTHLPIVLGLNLTENIAMTPSILSRLAAAAGSATTPMSVLDDRGTRSAASNPLIRVLEDAMRFYFEFHFDQGEGYLAHLHDPLAAAVALDPDLVRYRQTDHRRRAGRHPDPRHDRGRLERAAGADIPTRTSASRSTRTHSSTGSSRAWARSRPAWPDPLLVHSLQVPPPLPVAQQHRASGGVTVTVEQHLHPGRPPCPGPRGDLP